MRKRWNLLIFAVEFLNYLLLQGLKIIQTGRPAADHQFWRSDLMVENSPKGLKISQKISFEEATWWQEAGKKRLIMNWTIGSVFWEVSGLPPCSSEVFLSGQWFRTTLLSFNLGLDLPFRFIPFQFFLVRRYVFNVFWHIRCGVSGVAFTDLQVDSGKYKIDHVLPLYRVPLHTCIRV